MKITIDTKEDSHEDIKKVMQILSHFSGKEPGSTEPVDTTNMMSMFGDNIPEPKPEDTAPNFSSFLNLTENKEEEEKKPKEEPKLEFF